MQIKTRLRCHLTPVRRENAGEAVEKGAPCALFMGT